MLLNHILKKIVDIFCHISILLDMLCNLFLLIFCFPKLFLNIIVVNLCNQIIKFKRIRIFCIFCGQKIQRKSNFNYTSFYLLSTRIYLPQNEASHYQIFITSHWRVLRLHTHSPRFLSSIENH